MIDPQSSSVLLHILTHPVVATILISAGIIGVATEIKAGAHGLGLLGGMLAFGLFFGASIMVGLAGWGTMLLLGLGVLAIAVEVFLLPGHGAAGILGAALVLASMVSALMGTAPTPADVLQAMATIAASVILVGAVAYGWIRHLPSSGRFSGLLHLTSSGASAGYIAAPARNDLIGIEGVAVTDLRPAGTIEVNGEKVDVVTEGEYVRAGSKVTVLRTESYRHIVKAVT